MISVTKGMLLQGLDGKIINVEVDIFSGIPCWEIVGLPDTNIRESKERVKAAIRNCKIELKSKKYIINLSPASMRKEGAYLDLAIAVGVLKSLGVIINQNKEDILFVGELSLDGNVNSVNGILPICAEALKNGIKKIVVPYKNINEALILKNIEVIGVKHLKDVIEYLNFNKKISIDNIEGNDSENIEAQVSRKCDKEEKLDFSDVKGNEFVKRALEISAAGGHNCIMIGNPGTGKTMLAKRMPSILPNLTFEEALEITKIHSIAGKLENGKLVDKRPFRNPHHTITEKALIGGGKIPKPGEISLAHLGILFLDELLEFNKNTLEVLREPIEDKKINISRVGINVNFPCNFIIIASMNPCPCGYYGSKLKECTCSQRQRLNYQNKLSGPLLDRFDMHIRVPEIEYRKIEYAKSEKSDFIKNRVNVARNIQKERYKKYGIYSNSELNPSLVEKYCILDKESQKVLIEYMEKLNLSLRTYSKILKVSRTIADLDQRNNIELGDVLEAIQYRNFDR